MKPLKKKKIIWSSNFAYALGLIASDGCLSNDGRHIDFTSKDEDLIFTFKDCLNLNAKVGKKTSGYTGRKDYFRVQFSNVVLYRQLIDIGIGSKKSKTIGVLKIPDEYFFDFLRGSFDGDGCIYAFWDKRWHSSYMFYINFVSASVDHLQWLQKTISRLDTRIVGSITSAKATYQLGYAKKSTKLLFGKMFYKNDLPYLKRKFIKAQKIFKIDDDHNNARVL